MKEPELARCDAKPDMNSALAFEIVASQKFAKLIRIQASRTFVIILNAISCFVNVSFEQVFAVQVWFRDAANPFIVFRGALWSLCREIALAFAIPVTV